MWSQGRSLHWKTHFLEAFDNGIILRYLFAAYQRYRREKQLENPWNISIAFKEVKEEYRSWSNEDAGQSETKETVFNVS